MTTQLGSGTVWPDPVDGVAWRKARVSGPQDNCVEVAFLPDGRVGVRDSKDPYGQQLVFTRHGWVAFLADARSGEFDLPT